MDDDVKLNLRKAVVLFQDENSLTFLNPFSGYYEDHLFVIYEDAYGDAVSGLMHRKTIEENYHLNAEVISEIIKQLNQ